MHILGVGVDLQLAGSQIVGDGSQTVEDILTVFLGDDALFGQHRGVHTAAPHILGDHPLIKADGGVEIVDARVHRLGKAAFPQLFCHNVLSLLYKPLSLAFARQLPCQGSLWQIGKASIDCQGLPC